MRVAVTQPYLFPYLGYFALLSRVDVCVLMDDTQFIRRGWIHRNQIPDPEGEPLRFGIPVERTERSAKLRDIRVAPTPWRKPLRRTFQLAYAKAAFRGQGFQSLTPIWEPETHLFRLVQKTLVDTAAHLGLGTRFLLESEFDCRGHGAERLVALAKAAGGTELHNLPGGRALYDEAWFASQGLPIHFVESDSSWSAIHFLMTEPKEATLARIRDWGHGSHTPCTLANRNPSETRSAGLARPE